MNAFLEFVKSHKFTVLFVALGLVLAILFFTIGFWRTLLLLVILALCFLIGYLLDQGQANGWSRYRLETGRDWP